MNLSAWIPTLESLALSAVFLGGCIVDDGDRDDDTGAAEGDTDEPGGETDTDAGGPLDLFACDLPLSCDPITEHTMDVDPPGAAECATRLALGDQPGAIDHTLQLGGLAFSDRQRVYVFLGDGTAVMQSRSRECDNFGAPGCDTDDPPPWEPSSEFLLCNVAVDPDIAAACECDETMETCDVACFATMWTEECAPVVDHTCESLTTLLTGGGA